MPEIRKAEMKLETGRKDKIKICLDRINHNKMNNMGNRDKIVHSKHIKTTEQV